MPKRKIKLSLKKEENTFTCKEQLCQVDTPRKWNSSKKRNVVIDATIQLSGVEQNDKIHQGDRLQREQIGTLSRFSKLPNAAIFGIEEMNTRDGMAIMDTRSHVPLWREMNQSCFNQWKRKRRMQEPTSKCILGSTLTRNRLTRIETARNAGSCWRFYQTLKEKTGRSYRIPSSIHGTMNRHIRQKSSLDMVHCHALRRSYAHWNWKIRNCLINEEIIMYFLN